MESSKQNIILEAKNITKYFYDPVKVKVLNDISFAIKRSEFVSIIGKSGCGKSTLLYVLSTMDSDYEGDLFIDGENMRGRKEKFLANIRNEKIGFVFQFHYLLPDFTCLKNVMILRLEQLYPFPTDELNAALAQITAPYIGPKKTYEDLVNAADVVSTIASELASDVGSFHSVGVVVLGGDGRARGRRGAAWRAAPPPRPAWSACCPRR